jgi:inhibitor of KinA
VKREFKTAEHAMSPTFEKASDHSLLVSFGNEISPHVHEAVYALTQNLAGALPDFINNIHPAYSSILVSFDLLAATFQEIEDFIQSALAASKKNLLPPARLIEIPVCYNEEFGPDLNEVGTRNNLTHEQVVEIHTSGEYRVYFIGFTPGFAYLGGLSPRLATPRLPSPRTKVPAGSVAIGGNQTAVYPISTPGGWRLIGRTPLKLFSPEKEPFSLLALGDQVRFRKISREEFLAQNENG